METIDENSAYLENRQQDQGVESSAANHTAEQEGDRALILDNPLIQSDLPRDTLERVSQILELMQYLDLSNGLDHNAQLGLFRIQQVLIESVESVSESLREP